jgi:hypothetical protein
LPNVKQPCPAPSFPSVPPARWTAAANVILPSARKPWHQRRPPTVLVPLVCRPVTLLLHGAHSTLTVLVSQITDLSVQVVLKRSDV